MLPLTLAEREREREKDTSGGVCSLARSSVKPRDTLRVLSPCRPVISLTNEARTVFSASQEASPTFL